MQTNNEMKILLVQPQGHWAGHSSSYTKYLIGGLFGRGSQLSLLTFDGLLDDQAYADRRGKVHDGIALPHALLDQARHAELLGPAWPGRIWPWWQRTGSVCASGSSWMAWCCPGMVFPALS